MTFDDVRMRGFRSRAGVDEVLAWIDTVATPPIGEFVTLDDAAGRVLVDDIVSEVDVPAFRRAAMDGYALMGASTFGATEAEPLRMRIVGDIRPGEDAPRDVPSGSALRIRTGASVPDGADAVLPAEFAEVAGDALLVRGEVPPGRHVGPVGEDVARGTTILLRGRVLRPQDLGLLSSIGRWLVPVARKPRVLLVTTGSEVLPRGTRPTGTRTADANGPMLAALLRRDGALVTEIGPVPDGDPLLEALIARHPGDLVVIAGASSVGPDDVAPLLAARHGHLVFHGIAVRPASPTGFATVANRTLALLPGNPVSALCAYDLFVGRLVRRLGRRPPAMPYATITRPLRRKLASELGRTDYVRVRLENGEVVPLTAGGAGILSTAVRGDGFVVVAASCEGVDEGQAVCVHLYDDPGC